MAGQMVEMSGVSGAPKAVNADGDGACETPNGEVLPEDGDRGASGEADPAERTRLATAVG